METTLKFLKKSNIEIIESLDEADDIAYSTEESFDENECIDCDILSETDEVYEVQFGDGTLSYIEKELVTFS